MENLAARRGPRAGVPQVHRMFSVSERMPRSSRTRQEGAVRRAALFCAHCRARNASARRPQPRGVAQGSAWDRLLQHHEVLHRSLPGGNSHHRQRDHSAQGARGGRVLRSVDHALPQISRRQSAEFVAAGCPPNALSDQGGFMQDQLKSISKAGIPEAIAKAELYRYLNEPEEAESICRDILAVDPDHQLARRMLGLAITDQFIGAASDRYLEVQSIFQGLRDPYAKLYYTGLLHERHVKMPLLVGYPPHSVLPVVEW